MLACTSFRNLCFLLLRLFLAVNCIFSSVFHNQYSSWSIWMESESLFYLFYFAIINIRNEMKLKQRTNTYESARIAYILIEKKMNSLLNWHFRYVFGALCEREKPSVDSYVGDIVIQMIQSRKNSCWCGKRILVLVSKNVSAYKFRCIWYRPQINRWIQEKKLYQK